MSPWRKFSLLCIGLSVALLVQHVEAQNPYTSSADEAAGAKLFRTRCARCHNFDGTGSRGPALTRDEFRYGSSDEDLFRTISFGIPASNMPNMELPDNQVWQIVAFVRSLSRPQTAHAQGDPRKGEALFRGKGFCLQCHAVNGEGGRIGPDLSDIGWLRTPNFLRESVTDPNKYVDRRYWSARVVDKQGNVVSGVPVNEDTYSIQIMDMGENLYSYWKSDLREYSVQRQSGMIPYGAFSATELDDLVTYLYSLRRREGPE